MKNAKIISHPSSIKTLTVYYKYIKGIFVEVFIAYLYALYHIAMTILMAHKMK